MTGGFGHHSGMRRTILGRRRSLPRSRRNICDLLCFSVGKHACVQSRNINVAALAAARDVSSVRVSWAALFVRSLVIVSTRWPILRQCYMRWPWAHVYEVEASVAMIAVHREFRGDGWTFFGRLQPPDYDSIESLQAEIARFSTGPVDQTFRVQYGQSRLPLVIRRAQIWLAYHAYPWRRVKHFGTFGMTTVGGRGCEIDTPPLMNSASFTYGPIDPAGNCRLTCAYDHRLIDGAPMADLLADVEQTLNGPVRAELEAISKPPADAPDADSHRDAKGLRDSIAPAFTTP
jgi:hypothetical protein